MERAVDEVIDLLWAISRVLIREQRLSDPGLGPTHHMVLHRLREAQERGEGTGSVRVADLSSWLRVTPAAVTQIVTDLERMDLARRRRSPEDRRVVEVAITTQGAAWIKERRARRRERFARLLSRLSDAQCGELVQILRQLDPGMPNGPDAVDPVGPAGGGRP